MPLLSIVIPVFNSEKYLSECLSSLFVQEQSGKIEVICVDDGSTDQSLKIIKEYSTRQVNLRWIAQENRGVSSARNKGMKIARGDYITFVDSDDWLEENFLSTVIPLLEPYEYDCLLFRLYECSEMNRSKIGTCSFSDAKNGTGKDMIEQIMDFRSPYCGYACGKIVKRSCLEESNLGELFFDENISLLEDELFWIQAAFRCSEVFFSTDAFYCYRKNAESLSSGFSENKAFMELMVRNRIVNLIEDNIPELVHLAKARVSLSEGGLIRKCFMYKKNGLLKVIRNEYWRKYPVHLVFKLNGASFLLKIGAVICDIVMLLKIPARFPRVKTIRGV